MASNLKIDLRQLNSFLTIAKRGSFSRASEALFIAQPALSRQIRLLEEALDAELFVRHGRGVLLTTAGEVLYERAKGLLKDTEQLQADVAAVSGTVTGQVKLGLLPTISNDLQRIGNDDRQTVPHTFSTCKSRSEISHERHAAANGFSAKAGFGDHL